VFCSGLVHGYRKFLGRPATPTEVTSGQSPLGSGADEQVIASVLGSADYFARAGLCSLYLPLVER
jgi:hypothetical protein